MPRGSFLFTSESVSEGHPDKVCDRISDEVVDAYLGADPMSRVACETLCTTNHIMIAGETRGPDSITKDLIEDLGTRLGESLRAFNDEWGQRGMARGATVVILSDGWDRGEPEVMAEQMGRLHRVAHEVIWVNPLKASPGYQPLAQGMAAALPFVDRFIEGHCLDSLDVLAGLLAEKGAAA